MREYQSAAAVTPNDGANLSVPTLAIMATVAGNIKVDMVRTGTAVVIPVTAGTIHRLRVKKIYAAGTTATGIVALW